MSKKPAAAPAPADDTAPSHPLPSEGGSFIVMPDGTLQREGEEPAPSANSEQKD